MKYLTIILFLVGCGQSEQAAKVDPQVLQLHYGIETLGGVFTPLLKQGATLPAKHSEIFSTAVDNQDQIKIHPYKGTAKLVSKCQSLGAYQVVNIPHAQRGVPQIEISFIVSETELFSIEARDLATGKAMKILTPQLTMP